MELAPISKIPVKTVKNTKISNPFQKAIIAINKAIPLTMGVMNFEILSLGSSEKDSSKK